jgi:hypothetical protein
MKVEKVRLGYTAWNQTHLGIFKILKELMILMKYMAKNWQF